MSGDPASALAAALSEQARLGPSLDRLLRVVEGWAGLAPVGPAPEGLEGPVEAMQPATPPPSGGNETGSRPAGPSAGTPWQASETGRHGAGQSPMTPDEVPPSRHASAAVSPGSVTAAREPAPYAAQQAAGRALQEFEPSASRTPPPVFARLVAPDRAARSHRAVVSPASQPTRAAVMPEAPVGQGDRPSLVAGISRGSAPMSVRGFPEIGDAAEEVSRAGGLAPPDSRDQTGAVSLPPRQGGGTMASRVAGSPTIAPDVPRAAGNDIVLRVAGDDLFADSALEEAIADALERAAREAGVDLS